MIGPEQFDCMTEAHAVASRSTETSGLIRSISVSGIRAIKAAPLNKPVKSQATRFQEPC